jgi:transcriptional repressor NrdR
MRCPFCQNEDTQVKDSRPTEDGASIRRRRQCGRCGARFTTFERVQLRELVVIKRSTGKKAPFERDKLLRSVKIALNKRPIDDDAVEQMVSGIVRRLESLGDSEIQSGVIGEMVMEALANLDPVAYVRYASVYKDFRAAGDFGKFLDESRLGKDRED